MSDSFHDERFEHEGRKFELRLYYDSDCDPPWENSDGHGPVREGSRRSRYYSTESDKRPGERPLNDPDRNQTQYWYDWQEACRLAKVDGWGIGPEEEAKLAEKLGRQPTKGEIRNAAVEADFKFLRGWLRDDWHYCGVAVRILDENDEPVGDEYENALWGVEFEGFYGDDAKYWREVANELAGDILHTVLKEEAERQWAAERDIMTVGA